MSRLRRNLAPYLLVLPGGLWLLLFFAVPMITMLSLSLQQGDIVKALSLDDLSILEPPNSNPESYIPRRQDYAEAWSEVKAA